MLKHVGLGIGDRAETLNRFELIKELLLLNSAAIRIDLCRHRRTRWSSDHEQKPERDHSDQREKPRHARSPSNMLLCFRPAAHTGPAAPYTPVAIVSPYPISHPPAPQPH